MRSRLCGLSRLGRLIGLRRLHGLGVLVPLGDDGDVRSNLGRRIEVLPISRLPALEGVAVTSGCIDCRLAVLIDCDDLGVVVAVSVGVVAIIHGDLRYRFDVDSVVRASGLCGIGSHGDGQRGHMARGGLCGSRLGHGPGALARTGVHIVDELIGDIRRTGDATVRAAHLLAVLGDVGVVVRDCDAGTAGTRSVVVHDIGMCEGAVGKVVLLGRLAVGNLDLAGDRCHVPHSHLVLAPRGEKPRALDVVIFEVVAQRHSGEAVLAHVELVEVFGVELVDVVLLALADDGEVRVGAVVLHRVGAVLHLVGGVGLLAVAVHQLHGRLAERLVDLIRRERDVLHPDVLIGLEGAHPLAVAPVQVEAAARVVRVVEVDVVLALGLTVQLVDIGLCALVALLDHDGGADAAVPAL